MSLAASYGRELELTVGCQKGGLWGAVNFSWFSSYEKEKQREGEEAGKGMEFYRRKKA